MKSVTAAEMREIDRAAIDDFGIPAAVLMNSAGKFTAEFIIENFKGHAVTIFCGTGNNGGDGFTAAYYLFNTGFDVSVFLCGGCDRVTPVSAIFMNICRKSGILIHELTAEKNVLCCNVKPGIIVDAIFGTGFSGKPAGVQLAAIQKINSLSMKVLSIDIPSGLVADGDIVEPEAVRADITITIGLPKISISTFPGRAFCGKVLVADIGFPRSLTNSDNLKVNLIDDNLFRTNGLSIDQQDMHKGDRGHVLLAGGFPGMEGAIILAAKALFRTGTGLGTVITLRESRRIIAGKIPELMTAEITESEILSRINDYLKDNRFTGLVLGPGLGRSVQSRELFEALINAIPESGISRVIIDGDALFHLAEYLKRMPLPEGPEYCITPHFMEASRLAGTAIHNLKSNRLRACIDLALTTGTTAVLKGPSTIVSDGNETFINTTGNSRLATAGSGDVLSGIIASFMHTGISFIRSAACAVYLHGLAADIYADANPFNLMKAGDIIKRIPDALEKIYSGIG